MSQRAKGYQKLLSMGGDQFIGFTSTNEISVLYCGKDIVRSFEPFNNVLDIVKDRNDNIIAINSNNMVRIYNSRGAIENEFKAKAPMNRVIVCENGNILAAESKENGQICLYTPKGELVRQFSKNVFCSCIALLDGDKLAIGNEYGNNIEIYDITSGRLLDSLPPAIVYSSEMLKTICEQHMEKQATETNKFLRQ